MTHFLFALYFFLLVSVASAKSAKPNLIFILADDLGYAELGCYGQKIMKTPHLDRMAQEGMRFTHFYAGACVCAPSRCVLMTGQHQGHTRVRGNAAGNNPTVQALKAEDVTVAKVLCDAGYRTGLIGKWGLGNVGPADTGLPNKQGFDHFCGYLSQHHAHNHFPDYLWSNDSPITLPNRVKRVGEDGAGYATEAVQFADDYFADECLKFVSENKERPFFLYWSMVIPHANNERARDLGNGAQVPDFGPYKDKDWPEQDKGHAAMVSRMDSYVGRLLEHLKKEGLAENTLVIFTSDNGPHNESKHDYKRFQPAGPYTGMKRTLTDGGIRVPFIAWWPTKIRAGGTSAHVGSFADWMPTTAELAETAAPANTDGISLVPSLLGKGTQQAHEYLYWEFHEGGFQQATLYQGRWKGIRAGEPDAAIQLYDQQNDPAEQNNIAANHPEIAKRLSTYLATARSATPDWEPKWKTEAKKQKKAAKGE